VLPFNLMDMNAILMKQPIHVILYWSPPLWTKWQIVVILDFWGSSGWFTSHSWLVKCYYHVQQQFNLPDRSGRSHGGGYGRTCQLASSLTYPWGASIPVLQMATTLSFCCNRKLVPYEIQLW
jgi:hypothetical protein